MAKLYPSKRDLGKLYLKGKLCTHKIVQQYGCGKTTIKSRLREYNIAPRSISEALKLVPRSEKYRISRETLKELYWSENKNILGQVYRRLKLFGAHTTPPRIMIKGGYIDKRGVRTFKDLWSV